MLLKLTPGVNPTKLTFCSFQIFSVRIKAFVMKNKEILFIQRHGLTSKNEKMTSNKKIGWVVSYLTLGS